MLEWLNIYRADLQHIASLLLGLAMWRLGGAPERAMALAFGALVIAPVLAARMMGLDAALLANLAWLYVLFDSAAAAAFLMIALAANRNYPMWVAGFQLVSMSAHVVRGMVDTVSTLAYVILAVGPSYCQLILLAAGLSRHLWRQRTYGDYRSWRVGSGLSGLWAR